MGETKREGGRKVREKHRALPEKEMAQNKVYYRHLGAKNVLSVKMQSQTSKVLFLLTIHYLTHRPPFPPRLIGLREAMHQSNERSTGVLGEFLRKDCV